MVSYLGSKEHSFKPKGWIDCVTVNQEHRDRLQYLVFVWHDEELYSDKVD